MWLCTWNCARRHIQRLFIAPLTESKELCWHILSDNVKIIIKINIVDQYCNVDKKKKLKTVNK